jgi:hypothetical protein
MNDLPILLGLVERDGDPVYQVAIEDRRVRREVARTGFLLYALEDFLKRHVDPSLPLPARLHGHVSHDRAWIEVVSEAGTRRRYIVEADWPQKQEEDHEDA